MPDDEKEDVQTIETESRTMKDWFIARADTKAAQFWLAALAFAESSFFPIPPDVLLVAIVLAAPQAWKKSVLVTTIASILGGLLGYLIGAVFFEVLAQPLIDFYNLADGMAKIQELFSGSAFIAVLISAFTPIPYKVFTISAGFFNVALLPFVIASAIGRGARFFLVAYVMKRLGEHAGKKVYKYANMILLLLALVALFLIFR